MLTDEVDLQLQRHQHGWSSARLWVNGAPHDYDLTHIWGDPLAALIAGAIRISSTSREVAVDLYDEPGRHQWVCTPVQAQLNLVTFVVATYPDRESNHIEPIKRVSFTTEYRYWKTLVYSEAAKIQRLLTFSTYRAERSPGTFPRDDLRVLGRQLNQSELPIHIKGD
ncbi:MAG: hypothetical protein ACO1QR_06580 [Chthoniobacteraceae bacterium]